ncbi:MAG: hypothetical protein E7137_05520 [Rikenellaceae bacterium]|nr:hypothetical protein [Rikenellaceae bacterium]
MNLTRQPLLIAFPTLVAVLVLLLLRKQQMSFAPETAAIAPGLVEGWVLQFQHAYTKSAWGVWLLLQIVAALTLGRMGLRHNLYAGNTLLAVPLYAITACGIFLSDNFLTGALLALLLTRAMRNLCVSYRNGYTFSSLFRGSLYLGLLPALYPPALPLVLLAPLAIILFKRTLRETIVTLTGLLLPLGALCYLHWAFTGIGGAPLQQIASIFASPERFHLFQEASPVLIALLVVILAATLCALFYYLNDIYAATSKARAILTAHVWLFLISASTLMMPSATANSLILVAVPISMLLPFLFARLKQPMANALYLVIIGLFLAHLFI